MKIKIFLFFPLFFITANAQELAPPPMYEEIDSAIIAMDEEYYADSIMRGHIITDNIIYPKKFKNKFQSNYKGENFDYTTVKPRESLWQKIKRRFAKIFESIFGKVDPLNTMQYTTVILRIVGVIIIGFVLYFLLKFLVGKEGNFFFSKKNKKLHIDNQDLVENIHEINFQHKIENFERQQDYRSAVRYRFLSVLKELSDRKMIQWNPEKTNQDYLAEIKQPEMKSGFKELAYIFDYVWYGEFDINENNYNHFKQKFLNYKK